MVPDARNNSDRHYRLFLPFSVDLTVVSRDPKGGSYSMLFTCCPVFSRETIQWFFSSRNWDLHIPEDDWRAFDEVVMQQDQVIVENQRPEELPLDLTEERTSARNRRRAARLPSHAERYRRGLASLTSDSATIERVLADRR